LSARGHGLEVEARVAQIITPRAGERTVEGARQTQPKGVVAARRVVPEVPVERRGELRRDRTVRRELAEDHRLAVHPRSDHRAVERRTA
jgi:hypothetical protein